MPNEVVRDRADDDARVAPNREAEIVAVAAACFERYGVHRTRVEDVAEQAGISRVYFYQFFKSREALVDAVVSRQLGEIVDQVGPRIWAAPTREEAFVEGAVQIVEACRANAVFMEILRRTSRTRLSELSLQPAASDQDMLRRLWEPVLIKAREAGELRPALTQDAGVIAWLGSVLLLFLLGEKVTDTDIRETMRAYVVPGLLQQ